MELNLSILIFALVIFTAVGAEKARFDNYHYYTISIENELQLRVLRELSEVSDSYTFADPPTYVGSSADVIVPPHQFAHFSELVEKFNLQTTLNSDNFQKLVDNESPKRQRKADLGDMDWTSYYSTVEIHVWLDKLQQTFPQYITVEEIGKSFEGRSLKLVKLSKKQNNRAIFIEGNIHAREWISGATSTYVLNELLFSSDPEIQDLANNVDWYIIPISNPDGYEFSRNSNRNWRKTRSPVSTLCNGVDPNRNFGFNWLTADESGNLGASRLPCSDTFAGSRPFSEPETQAIENFLSQNYAKFDIYLSFHSFAHMMLFPFGHTSVRIPNFNDHLNIGQAAADRLFAVDGVRYTVGPTRETLYAASGVSSDHAYGHHRIPLSYTYEMRGNGDYGNHGFVLPPEFIIPNGKEVLASLVGMVQKSRQLGYFKNQ
ncbi:CLUMA_CG019442, isoform A [Clunio marinus]|uniref:Zinc carboxypeptidase A 1 n=1 Tax=Clunio marinus TaxID=568069 RepID=A0A1J1J6M1_9DIPT|nr:CLUMA_CG019442, isoform A [Clunio marinus]